MPHAQNIDIFPDPAYQIHKLLTTAKGQGDGETVRSAWMKAFRLTDAPLRDVYLRLAWLDSLVDDIEDHIKAIPSINHGLFLRNLPEVRTILSPTQFDQNWAHVKRLITQPVLDALEHCSDRIRHNYRDRRIPHDDISQLSRQIDDLIQFVRQADIGDALKQALTASLLTLRRSIEDYHLFGVDRMVKGLHSGFEELMTALNRNPPSFRHDEAKSLLDRLGSVSDTLEKVVTAAKNGKEIFKWGLLLAAYAAGEVDLKDYITDNDDKPLRVHALIEMQSITDPQALLEAKSPAAKNTSAERDSSRDDDHDDNVGG